MDTIPVRSSIPTRVLIDEMDRAVRLREQAERTARRIAAHLGFERVRPDEVDVGDVVHVEDGKWGTVTQTCITYLGDDNDPFPLWTFHTDNGEVTVSAAWEATDEGFVSRRLPDPGEPF